MTSPHLLGSMDNLEPFHDPFYKPGWSGSQSIHQATLPPEFWKTLDTCDVRSTGEGCVNKSNGMHAVKHGECAMGDVQLQVVAVWVCAVGMAVAASGTH